METTSNNLSTLRICYIIYGIFMIFGFIIAIAYAFFGNFMFQTIDDPEVASMAISPSLVFTIIGAFGALVSGIYITLSFLMAKYLKEARNYTFAMVVAVIMCLTGVLGILLGVFTIIELNKPHVKQLFGKV